MNTLQKLKVKNQFQGLIFGELSSQTNQQSVLANYYNTPSTGISYDSSSSSLSSYYASRSNPDYV